MALIDSLACDTTAMESAKQELKGQEAMSAERRRQVCVAE